MATFLLILGGLIAFNFILLKFSMQSVDSDKKKAKAVKSVTNSNITKTKTTRIPKAA
ncbi:hypothetical protein SAMN04487910_0773 [Aquimarina amphilecti]|uniref:Uncharacterized protein n=1 Tax=Aquimarina amphilecti TaxID=1038014 RepID=A0A1H7HX61_AQUAM|nr:hypothetical protein [Aquimarina amphilecti]SEK54227.1 hypothetical protein SAMN04487910_0773 [Aquimarina amphilecti]